MGNTITKEQLEEIEEAKTWGERQEAYALLEKYTGIKAKPCIIFLFYDDADNYIGDDDNHTIRDLLENAYIDVVEKGGE